MIGNDIDLIAPIVRFSDKAFTGEFRNQYLFRYWLYNLFHPFTEFVL